MKNKLDRALQAAGDLHSDRSSSLEETLERLEILHDEILDLINAIREDIDRRDMENEKV